ncbi:hypothetical protein BDZ97DRAFT_1912510 [Flammula alnicola]|nr:hypothetical protein BDZ97DRAFT_1912510 [Flammula alnicola]
MPHSATQPLALNGRKRKEREEESHNPSPIDGIPTKKLRTTASPTLDEVASDDDRAPESQPEESESEDSLEDPYTPDENFYYEDGNIFVVVGDILFCVHKEKLGAQGGKLAYLNSPAKHPATTEIIYGLPLIRLSDLSVRSFRFLLAHIYGRITLSRTLPDCNDWLHWDAAVSLLKTSHALDLKNVRRAALKALECLFPSTLEPSPHHPIIAGLSLQRRGNFRRVFPIQALALFHDTGVDEMLPMAYYHAAQLSVVDIVNGVRDGDELIKLSDKDTLVVLGGREMLRTSRRRVTFFWISLIMADYGLQTASPECTQWRQSHGLYCYGFLRQVFIAYDISRYLEGPNALEILPRKACDILQAHLCKHCWEQVEGMIDYGLQTNRKRLAGYFGLNKKKRNNAKQG